MVFWLRCTLDSLLICLHTISPRFTFYVHIHVPTLRYVTLRTRTRTDPLPVCDSPRLRLNPTYSYAILDNLNGYVTCPAHHDLLLDSGWLVTIYGWLQPRLRWLLRTTHVVPGCGWPVVGTIVDLFPNYIALHCWLIRTDSTFVGWLRFEPRLLTFTLYRIYSSPVVAVDYVVHVGLLRTVVGSVGPRSSSPVYAFPTRCVGRTAFPTFVIYSVTHCPVVCGRLQYFLPHGSRTVRFGLIPYVIPGLPTTRFCLTYLYLVGRC